MVHVVKLADINQVIEAFKEISPLEFALCFKRTANLKHYTPDERRRIFAAIPENINTLYFYAFGSNAAITQIAMQFSSLPKRIRSLVFINSTFVGTIDEVTNALRTIPDTVQTMEFSSCNIDIRDVEPHNAFPAFFAALPRNLTSFHYRNDDDDDIFKSPRYTLIDPSVLIRAIKLLPPGLITFTFSTVLKKEFDIQLDPEIIRAFSGIYSYSWHGYPREKIHVQANIPQIIAALPGVKSSLDLKYMNLGLLSGDELEQLARALPEEVTHIDLSFNSLSKKSLLELHRFFNALTAKPHLAYLDLTDNGQDNQFIRILIKTLIAPKSGLLRIDLNVLFKTDDLKNLLKALKTNPNLIHVELSHNYNENSNLVKEINKLGMRQQIFPQVYALFYHEKMEALCGRVNLRNKLPEEMKRNILAFLSASYGIFVTPAWLDKMDSLWELATTNACTDYNESKPVITTWRALEAACRTEKPPSDEINQRVEVFLNKITSIVILGQVFEEFMKNVPGYRSGKNDVEPESPKIEVRPGRLALIRLFQKRAQELSLAPDRTNTLSHILGVVPVEMTEEEPPRAGPANA